MSYMILLAALAFGPAQADEIWVTNGKDDTISVIDIETFKVTRTLPTGERPRGITFSKDDSRGRCCIVSLMGPFYALVGEGSLS